MERWREEVTSEASIGANVRLSERMVTKQASVLRARRRAAATRRALEPVQQ